METQISCNKSFHLQDHNNDKSELILSNNISKKFPTRKKLLSLLEGDNLLKGEFTLSNFISKKNSNSLSTVETNDTFFDDEEEEKKIEATNELSNDKVFKDPENNNHLNKYESSDI